MVGSETQERVLVTQSCPTLCDPMDCSPSSSSVHGILQARILEEAAIPFSRDLPNPGVKLGSPVLQADSLVSEPPGKPPLTQRYVPFCIREPSGSQNPVTCLQGEPRQRPLKAKTNMNQGRGKEMIKEIKKMWMQPLECLIQRSREAHANPTKPTTIASGS